MCVVIATISITITVSVVRAMCATMFERRRRASLYHYMVPTRTTQCFFMRAPFARLCGGRYTHTGQLAATPRRCSGGPSAHGAHSLFQQPPQGGAAV